MKKKFYLKNLLKDEKAVSEEFTSLPALAVVMIGFTLFFALIANVYAAYEERIDSLDKYQTADFIAVKLTNPDSYFIRPGGIVDLPLLHTDESRSNLVEMQNQYKASGVNFILRISWNDIYEDFPNQVPSDVVNRIAVSKNVGVYLNRAQTETGKLTIIMWEI